MKSMICLKAEYDNLFWEQDALIQESENEIVQDGYTFKRIDDNIQER